MAKTGVIRIDEEVKKTAEALLNGVGMSVSTAAEVFFRQMIKKGKIPFDIEMDSIPNNVTVAAIREGDEMLKKGTGKRYSSTKSMFDDILSEDN